MLKLPEERRRWGESKGAGRGRPGGEREENFLPSPFPLSFFRPRTYRKGYYFYSPQSSTVIKSKMVATTILRTRTRFRPPTIRLHCRLHSSQHCWDLLRPCWQWCANGCNNSQQHETCNRVCKRTQHVTSNNVASVCMEIKHQPPPLNGHDKTISNTFLPLAI